jgi:hypothetical protein
MTEPSMPQPSKLTRRRSVDRPDCWHIYYGDVQAGTIAMRAGNPHDMRRGMLASNCRRTWFRVI